MCRCGWVSSEYEGGDAADPATDEEDEGADGSPAQDGVWVGVGVGGCERMWDVRQLRPRPMLRTLRRYVCTCV